MRTFVLVMIPLLIDATLTGCSIRKHDEVECGLPDGSSFILRASYDWYPLARFIPHAAERLNETGLSTYYKAKDSRRQIGPLGGIHHPHNYYELEIARQLCSPFGLINKVPYVLLTDYKLPGDDEFITVEVDRSLFFDPAHGGELPSHVLETLAKLDASIGIGALVWRPNKLVLEKRVIRREPPHVSVAVYRIESLDGGRTWINPHITTEAEAFTLGKTFDEQCFIARLVRIDNRRIEANFPPCAISEALPE